MVVRTRLLTPIALASAIVLHAATAQGAECVGVQFPDTVKVGNSALVLNGMGLRKATFLKVKVYVAGLYLPAKSGNAQQIAAANQPWELVLRFVHDADSDDIQDAFEDGFKNNAGDKVAALRPRIDELKSRIVDFKVGNVLSYTYEPATGTVINVNGKRGAAIPGADFASALLALSIGPNPPNEDLKSGLLGGTCE